MRTHQRPLPIETRYCDAVHERVGAGSWGAAAPATPRFSLFLPRGASSPSMFPPKYSSLPLRILKRAPAKGGSVRSRLRCGEGPTRPKKGVGVFANPDLKFRSLETDVSRRDRRGDCSAFAVPLLGVTYALVLGRAREPIALLDGYLVVGVTLVVARSLPGVANRDACNGRAIHLWPFIQSLAHRHRRLCAIVTGAACKA
jgi:hypothetical protein